MDRTLLQPAPRDDSYYAIYDENNRKKDLNVRARRILTLPQTLLHTAATAFKSVRVTEQ